MWKMWGKVGVICTLIFKLVMFAQIGSCEEISSLPQDERETIPETPMTEEIPISQQAVKTPNLVTIDLSECTCKSVSSCELTILKTPLMDITCGDSESLCCSPVKSTASSESTEKKEAEDSLDEPTAVAPRSNVRVYSITPYIFKDVDSTSAEDASSIKQRKNKSKKCSCKTRGTCPHKYIDYGFGFYCTYNTVRCCLPEEIVEEAGETLATEHEKVPETGATSEPIQNTDEAVSLQAMGNEENGESSVEMGTSVATEENSTAVVVGESETTSEILMDDKQEVAANEDPTTAGIEEASNLSEVVEELNVEESFSTNEEGEERDEDESVAAGDDLIITEVTNWSSGLEGEDDYAKEAECFCMSIEKCRMSGSYDNTNMIERRRDTLCPADLVQCCGRDLLDEITKKKDEVAGEYDVAVPVKADIPESSLPEPFQPAPSSDALPTINNANTDEAPEAPQMTENVPSSSNLPVPYPGYQPPGYYKGYSGSQQQPVSSYHPPGEQQITQNLQPYRYNTQPQPSQQSQNQYGFNGGHDYNRPWIYSKNPPQYNNGQLQREPYQPRYPYTDNGTARHKPGGLFETLSKYLG